MQRMKEQAEEQLRLSSERSAADILAKEEALVKMTAEKAASEQEVRDLKAAIAEPLKQKGPSYAISVQSC